MVKLNRTYEVHILDSRSRPYGVRRFGVIEEAINYAEGYESIGGTYVEDIIALPWREVVWTKEEGPSLEYLDKAQEELLALIRMEE